MQRNVKQLCALGNTVPHQFSYHVIICFLIVVIKPERNKNYFLV